MVGILETNRILSSRIGAGDAHYGTGVYLTDIPPGTTLSKYQVSYRLFAMPWKFRNVSHYVEILALDLLVEKPKDHIFVILTEKPLDVSGRIVSYGEGYR